MKKYTPPKTVPAARAFTCITFALVTGAQMAVAILE